MGASRPGRRSTVQREENSLDTHTRSAAALPEPVRGLGHDEGVNEAHLKLLKRQASSKPRDSAGLQLKAKALEALIGHFGVEQSPQLLETMRGELLQVMDRSDANRPTIALSPVRTRTFGRVCST